MSSSILCLGDSYTIGESVRLIDSFPYQLVQLLRREGMLVQAPEIVAKTGWTSDELLEAMRAYHFSDRYDYVTLLIGVNNQYRGRPLAKFQEQFVELLQNAITFAGQATEKVFVLSIPDWSVTPFAEGRDRTEISQMIDQFNMVVQQESVSKGVHFIEITQGTREATEDESLLASDKLHPSAKEYARWAERIKSIIVAQNG